MIYRSSRNGPRRRATIGLSPSPESRLASEYLGRCWAPVWSSGGAIWCESSIKDARSGSPVVLSNEASTLLGPELRTVLRELRAGQSAPASIHVEWSREVLHNVLNKELPDTDVIVASNREPYIHNRVGDDVVLQIPASGLVAALEPVMRACGGTWVAHGSGSADRDSVDAHDRVGVPPASPAYVLRRLWLSEEEQNGYYYGFANEGLWPLCHIAFVRPTFRESDWRMYQSVNERFADAVAEESKDGDPIILVQDYHFSLLPRLAAQAPAARDDPDVLAYPLAECRDVQHLSVEGRDY